MDIAVRDACAKEIKEMTVAEQDANNHLSVSSLFSLY
jgi:hypothetical protein